MCYLFVEIIYSIYEERETAFRTSTSPGWIDLDEVTCGDCLPRDLSNLPVGLAHTSLYRVE